MNKEFVKRFLSSLIILPIALLFIVDGSVFFIFFLSILFLATSYEWIKMSKKRDLNKIFGIIFLILSFYTSFKLRNYAGLNFFLFICLISVFTDIGGYIFGKFFKGPKLTKISPNKTYSGVIGSFILPLIAGLIYTDYFTFGVIVSLKLQEISNNMDLTFLFLVLSISIISQVGDLIISYFKRLAKIKDTGKILPGHGGLLDRVDGLIFVIPASYLFIIL
jgi:phosphatidate cytidylyltransferase